MGAPNDGAGAMPGACGAFAVSTWRISSPARCASAASPDEAGATAAPKAGVPGSATGARKSGAAGMNASSTIGAVSSCAGVAACSTGTSAACAAMP
ncbi:hypothetical protein BPA30113_01658 [Burkholderia paludis]|uniref:Uncharacterized protein n=1 Tax=Burkholderia paludis TaxID=1506587 RepID=A0A6J5F1R9_9BURK|nr:hypothetical protein LMG30113_06827 [Burkholderia paludis]VWB40307.1 hypothetical protein BPA30113_01658 [Burkholderia paludis]